MHTKLLWKFGVFCSWNYIISILWIYFNIYVLYLWSAIATISVCISHSNSKCYLDDGVQLLHHKLLKCNFGTGLYIIDRVCNSHES